VISFVYIMFFKVVNIWRKLQKYCCFQCICALLTTSITY